MNRVAVAVLLLALVGVAGCGDDRPAPTAVEVPEWAKVAPEQIAEAKKHGVPVAFENELGMRFVLIPSGTFLMGSPKDEPGRRDDETQHEVTIVKPYYMQITEVTNAQYRRHVRSHDSGSEGFSLDGDTQPAAAVSWDAAQSFADWLTTEDASRTYRLPSEAEWERAARAGTGTPYFFGGDRWDLALYTNFADESISHGEKTLDDGHPVSAPVGSYRPNPWGLLDMLGNVYEWCQDWYVD